MLLFVGLLSPTLASCGEDPTGSSEVVTPPTPDTGTGSGGDSGSSSTPDQKPDYDLTTPEGRYNAFNAVEQKKTASFQGTVTGIEQFTGGNQNVHFIDNGYGYRVINAQAYTSLKFEVGKTYKVTGYKQNNDIQFNNATDRKAELLDITEDITPIELGDTTTFVFSKLYTVTDSTFVSFDASTGTATLEYKGRNINVDSRGLPKEAFVKLFEDAMAGDKVSLSKALARDKETLTILSMDDVKYEATGKREDWKGSFEKVTTLDKNGASTDLTSDVTDNHNVKVTAGEIKLLANEKWSINFQLHLPSDPTFKFNIDDVMVEVNGVEVKTFEAVKTGDVVTGLLVKYEFTKDSLKQFKIDVKWTKAMATNRDTYNVTLEDAVTLEQLQIDKAVSSFVGHPSVSSTGGLSVKPDADSFFQTIIDRSDYIESFAGENVYAGSEGSGIKFSTGSKDGKFTINLKQEISSLKLEVGGWKNDKFTVTVEGSSTSPYSGTGVSPTEFSTVEFKFDVPVKTINITFTKRVFLKTIDFKQTTK